MKKAIVKKTPPVHKKEAVRKPAPEAKPRAGAVSPAPPPAAPPVVVEKPRPAPVASGKIVPGNFLLELANAIREAISPLVLSAKGREVVGAATSGDATFQLDKVAEKALLTFLKDSKYPLAYYSEDAGYTTFTSGQPKNLLIVDPIDGTRAAKSGFESCVVAIGSTRVIERPTISDLDNACLLEITRDRAFYAEKSRGARIYERGKPRRPKLSRHSDLELLVWSMTVPARPAELIFPTAAKLIDLSSLKGGFFACNSTSYSLSRLLTGQLDACLDFANRFYRDIPSAVEDQFINAGRGSVMGVAPYDIGPAYLIAKEAGCVVTDAYGKSLDDVLLLDCSVANLRSVIAASNKELHEKLLNFLEIRINQYEQLLRRRVAAS